MLETNHWKSIAFACEILNISRSTLSTWKNRGEVPKSRRLDIYQVLLGTDHELSLRILTNQQNNHPTEKLKNHAEGPREFLHTRQHHQEDTNGTHT